MTTALGRAFSCAPMADTPETDALVARLEQLLIDATEAARRGDAAATILLTKEILATAQKLPRKKPEAP